MKVRSHIWDRFWLACLRYFGYEPENIRQAELEPGRYYYYNGAIIKIVSVSQTECLERQTLHCSLIKDEPDTIIDSVDTQSKLEEIDSGCYRCPFFERWPCPLKLTLPDGSKICHSYKFIIVQDNYNA